MPRTTLKIDGMHCASCVARVEKALLKVQGAEEASVNLTTERATVDGQGVVADELITAVHSAGYEAKIIDSETAHHDHGHAHDHDGAKGRKWFTRSDAIYRALFTLPFAIGVMVLDMGVDASWSPWVQFVIASALMVVLGTPFFLNAAKGLRYTRVDMDTLVALGSGVAYLSSIVMLLQAGHGMLAFGTAVAILWFITLGHALEHKARRSAASALDKLRQLAPDKATVIRGAQEVEMPIDEVPAGAVVLVKPGGRVPLDGKVTQGESTINQAMVTGESEPVQVASGSEVFAGTINQTGSLRITVTATGAKTLLGQIVEMVEQAQSSKAEIQRLADKVAGVFVPIVIVVAVCTLLGWGLFDANWARGLTACIAVLIVACPCALGLAVPTAILVGTGVGAERGILIKDPAALERAYGLTHIILDKTGTLTTGKPSVTGYYCIDEEIEDDQMLRYAAAAEQDSEHPLAAAIVKSARDKGMEVPPSTNFKSATAAGVTASVEGRIIKVGRLSALKEQGVAVPEGIDEHRDEKLGGARTLVAVAVDNTAVGLIGLADEIRPEARDTLAALKKLGLRAVMMTGDSQFAADHVARELSIERTYAEVKPADKREHVRELQGGNRSVVMVGDGINDAPALAEADLGIAIGSGTDIARDAGHIVLLGNDIKQLPTAIRLGRATMRRIIAGLIWASIYNVCLIPMAATGLLNPMYAALAMSLSSVSVVINALWLRWTWRG